MCAIIKCKSVLLQEAQLSPRDRASAAHYTGGKVDEVSAVGQMHRFEIFAAALL